MALALSVAFLLVGCSAKLGPGQYGWASWDVCGYEGGVAAELQILAMSTRLGCMNPEQAAVVDAQITDPITQPTTEDQ